MKTLRLISIALLSSFLVGSVALATGNKNENTVNTAQASLRQELTGVLSDAVDGETGWVRVIFSISANNSFKVLDVEGNNINLNEEVESALEGVYVNVPDLSSGEYMIEFNFTK
jgi:hypothetical protein